MCSQLARELFHVPSVLARIYDPRREDVFSHFGLHTVCPTNLTVGAIRSALTENQTIRTINFGAHTIAFNLIPVPDEMAGKRVKKISERMEKEIFGVIREDLEIVLTITDDITVKPGEMLITATLMD